MDVAKPAVRKEGLNPEGWVDRHGDCLYRYALLRVRKADAAAELVQETFLAALRSREQFTGESSERTWLVGILKHKLMDHLRRNRRPDSGMVTIEPSDATQELFDRRGTWKHKPHRWGGNPAEVIQEREFRKILEGCLGKLPRTLGDALFLRELDGKDSEEVCTVLAISPANLWARLHRARLLMRQCLELNWFDSHRRNT